MTQVLPRRLIVGISGASGAVYGIRLLQVLQNIPDVETHVIISKSARITVPYETDFSVKDVESMGDVVENVNDISASISSGSYLTNGMIVAPCSMKTLTSIVHSVADNLLTRSADVVLKEGRPLVLIPRETPLHVGHCKLLYEAAQMGIRIVPPMPAFYNRPKTIDDIVNHTVGRVLDLFDIDAGIVRRWQGPKTFNV